MTALDAIALTPGPGDGFAVLLEGPMAGCIVMGADDKWAPIGAASAALLNGMARHPGATGLQRRVLEQLAKDRAKKDRTPTEHNG